MIKELIGIFFHRAALQTGGPQCRASNTVTSRVDLTLLKSDDEGEVDDGNEGEVSVEKNH